MTTDVLAISFVYCPACFGGRKMRVRFKDNSVIEFKNAIGMLNYEWEYVEGAETDPGQFNRAWMIVASKMATDWMHGGQLFQGVDFL